MRLVCTSDWHGTLPENLPEGDVLVVAGDLCPVWNHERKFQANWLKGHLRDYLDELDYERIYLIAGNHDFVLENSTNLVMSIISGKVFYLRDASNEFKGVKFHGTPWTPTFYNWAFMKDEPILWTIPNDTDVLISHGPPKGHCDLTLLDNVEAGSPTLRNRIKNLPDLKYVICGHIHEGYGRSSIGNTEILNVSLMDFNYSPINPPVVIEV